MESDGIWKIVFRQCDTGGFSVNRRVTEDCEYEGKGGSVHRKFTEDYEYAVCAPALQWR